MCTFAMPDTSWILEHSQSYVCSVVDLPGVNCKHSNSNEDALKSRALATY